jgi:hypothetical protein
LPNPWEDDLEEDLDSKSCNDDVGDSTPMKQRPKLECCGDIANLPSHPDHDHHHDHHHHHYTVDNSVFIPKPVEAPAWNPARQEEFFNTAWRVANSETMYGSRQVLIVTPNRMIIPVACPPPGFASAEMVRPFMLN